MKHFFLFLLICCFAVISVQGQVSGNKDNKPASPPNCSCKDPVAWFDNDNKYGKKPLNDQKDIILDFRARALGIPKRLKIRKGDYIRVKVVNYNPFVYKVNVDNRDSSVAQPNDAGFLGMFLSPDKFSSSVANLINPLTIGTPPKEINIIKATDKQVNVFTSEWGSAEGKQLVYDKSNKIVKIDTGEIIRPLLKNYNDDAKAKKTKIQQLRKDVESKFEDLSKEYAKLQSLYLESSCLYEPEIREKASSYQSSLKSFSEQSRSISQELTDSATQFKINMADFMNYTNSRPWYKVRYAFIDTFYKMAAAELMLIDTSISPKKINEMYAGFIKLTQNSSCYTSLPIYISNEVKVFTISLKPVDEKGNLPAYQTSFAIPDYQSRVWGVSGGIFVTGLHNDIYSNRRRESLTDTFNLVADKQGKLQLGVNALAYMGWQIRNEKPDYLGVSFGAGMSLESKLKPRVLLGLSFITGEKNRISFTAGLAGGYVTVLSDAFTTTANYTKPAENYQKDVMKMSGFLSINYSFLSK